MDEVLAQITSGAWRCWHVLGKTSNFHMYGQMLDGPSAYVTLSLSGIPCSLYCFHRASILSHFKT